MNVISRGALFVALLFLPALASGEEAPVVFAPEVEIGCIPPNKPNCPPPELMPCVGPLYPPHPEHYPLCDECHWMWPNPLAWCRKLNGTADRAMFAPWVENECGSVDCDFVRPTAPLVRRYVTTADAVFLFRDDPDLVAFSTTFDADLTAVNGIDMGVAPRVSVMVPIDQVCDLEVNYFGLDSWNVTALYDLAGPGGGALDFNSQLHSVEINLRHNTRDWLTLLTGFRYIEYTESIDFIAPAVGVPALWQLDTRNLFYGAQVGADVGLIRLFDRFELGTIVKAGIFANRAEWRHDVRNFGTAVVFENQFNEFAFAGEWTVGGTLRLTDHSAIRGGYQMMWLEDVAKAINSFSEPDGLGGLFLHGAYAGIELRF